MVYSVGRFSNEVGVTPEILEEFKLWHALLLKWNAKINLVSKTAMTDFWQRHALDSWQVARFVPEDAKTILDLGSGGGFPAIALAISAKHAATVRSVTMVESAGKKANFLRTVVRELQLPANVISERVESLQPQAFDVISARAFAPLPALLTYAQSFWGENTQALLLKGQSVNDEIKQARLQWSFDAELFQSQSDPTGSLLKLTNLQSNI